MEKMTFKEFKNGAGFASYELREDEKLQGLKDSDIVVNFAYTDYGGDFFDRVCIEYFNEKHPESFIYENTSWFGKNGILLGDVAREFMEETENYLLGFNDIENYYLNMEHEAEISGFEWFVNDANINESEDCIQWLSENKGGHFSVLSSGDIDYCYSDLLDEVLAAGFTVSED